MNVENSDTFGNYLVHGIDEVMLPEAIAWWPSAPGWKVVGIVLTAWILRQAVRMARRWWRNRYRREALLQLQQLQQQAGIKRQDVVAALPYYIKATALQAYPRGEVASLSGEAWLSFLDAQYSKAKFSEGTGRKLLSVSYLPREQWQLDDAESNKLIHMAQEWIKNHRATADV
jgi:hypothetical protein